MIFALYRDSMVEEEIDNVVKLIGKEAETVFTELINILADENARNEILQRHKIEGSEKYTPRVIDNTSDALSSFYKNDTVDMRVSEFLPL